MPGESGTKSSTEEREIKEAVLITPSSQTPSHVLSLSSLDSQLFIRFTIEYLLIYRPPPPPHRSTTTTTKGTTTTTITATTHDRNTFTARIKAALGGALVPYYPLAGRVRAPPDGSNLEVVCRAQGAAFVEAVSDISVSEFQKAPRYSTQWTNLLSLHVADVLRGSPPLVVQLTWLADGAAAVGVGISHCICDGIGSAEFLNLFAELATGRRGLGDFKPKPVWDRHLLNPTTSLAVTGRRVLNRSVAHPEFNRVQDLCGFVSRFAREPLSPTSVTFDQKSLTGLKKLACSTSPQRELIKYTSFEVLSAHVWRSWAMALELPPAQTLRMLFSVNVRNRVKPSLPDGFYGNGFVLGCAQASVGELTEKGLGWASWLVKKAKERVGDEYVRSVVEEVSSESRANPDSVGVLIVSQWSRLGLEKVDFGMGKPVHVGPVNSERYCLFLPVYEQREAVKVMVAVPKSAVGKYEYLIRSPS
ncbi:Transferase [Macleaya cordata]|uniref:Transferase n=1 Tax=Macleaya cordata TaxID=56857 RepID=A0A200PX19_MACCD|nr:Transferase [Macleaya cordata]